MSNISVEVKRLDKIQGFIIHNGLFYVIGGDDGHSNLSSVEIFSPQRNVWSLLSSFLNEAKSYTGCVLIEKNE
jgi:kelch-like protein 2/3